MEPQNVVLPMLPSPGTVLLTMSPLPQNDLISIFDVGRNSMATGGHNTDRQGQP